MNTKTITTSRGQFNIRYGGRQDGVAVVMLHGWPESSFCWEGVAVHLDAAFRVIAPDLRGLGDSERTMDVNAYQKVELAKDVAEILQALNIETFLLVGHDWGGIVAQELALLIPERVIRLVIMNIAVLTNPRGMLEARNVIFSKGGIPFWYQYFQQQPLLPEAMIKGNENVWVRYFYGIRGMDGTIPEEAIAEHVRCYSIANTPATAAYYYRSMKLDVKHWATLAEKKLPMPSLYIHGSKDSVIISENLNHIEDGFDSIRVESLDTGHFVQEEKPREVASLMNDFFKAAL